MIKIIKAQPVPKEQIECTNCGSILEYENVDLELHQGYMTGYKYRFRCPVCGVFIDAKWIKPILITEEILLNNGFEQYDHMFKAPFIEMYEVENGWHLHIDNEKFETAIALTIKYVHQLQNAYYLATNNKLEIKL